MNQGFRFFFFLTVYASAFSAVAAELRIYPGHPGMSLQVLGDHGTEWRFQTTSDLGNWRDAPALRTMLFDVDPKAIPETLLNTNAQFFRAVRTDGLFDDHVLRTIHLTFAMSNWQSRLTTGRTRGTNTLANLELDNGLTSYGVGARYKGNTSFDMGGTKKSVNLEIAFTNSDARLMGYRTVNLNNAAGDETIMREPLFFNVMNEYAPSPKGALVKLHINGAYWGVYSFVEQENVDLVSRWFPSNDGDRWRTPNIGGSGPGGGGGLGGSGSALAWLGTNISAYRPNYELKTSNSTNAWQRLIHAIDVLNNTPTNLLRDKVEEVIAVDRWLWFLVVENVFADDDSYFNKGADYSFYYEPESGRLHPIEHDGNEAFLASDGQLSPVQGATTSNRPLLYRLLRIPELRQRYLAHMRTVLEERYHPDYLVPLVNRLHELSVADIITDTKKNYSMAAYTNDLRALKTFITNRYKFLTNHAELRPSPPRIEDVSAPSSAPAPGETPFIRARVTATSTNGVNSVWLYWRTKPYGRFQSMPMRDDGAHQYADPGDGIFGAVLPSHPAGTMVYYYVEARSAVSPNAASFAPPRAEQVTYSFRVRSGDPTNSPLLINELMADNTRTLRDPQGQFDDWIELHNTAETQFDLSGMYLTDDPEDPRQWEFPAGTMIAAKGYLLVWADQDPGDSPGLHASFRLSDNGEELLLVDRDTRFNAVLDAVTFGTQARDRSYGRKAGEPNVFVEMTPSPGAGNQD